MGDRKQRPNFYNVPKRTLVMARHKATGEVEEFIAHIGGGSERIYFPTHRAYAKGIAANTMDYRWVFVSHKKEATACDGV